MGSRDFNESNNLWEQPPVCISNNYLQVNIAPAEERIAAIDAKAIMIEVFFIMI